MHMHYPDEHTANRKAREKGLVKILAMFQACNTDRASLDLFCHSFV